MANATTEYATFDSFYLESSYISWGLATLAALAVGTVLFFTGGTASPVVVAIGTWFGGTMGLSGIAATNAGLAFFGGGSIASGGYGIVGGTALLTGVLTFGTDAAFDYSIGKAVSEYNYSTLVVQSENMATLPLPVNSSGPSSYEDAVEVLEDYDNELPTFASSNLQLVGHAIEIIKTDKEDLDEDEASKTESLLSLLYFISNDYVMANKYANTAIMHARDKRIRRTLPAFIYATSTLFEEEFDFTSVTKDYFEHSVLAEPHNKLIPLLFSIYLNRMSFRFNDDYLDERSLVQVFNIMKSEQIKDMRTQNYEIMLKSYFNHLNLEEQKIFWLVSTSNDTINNSPKTLTTVHDSLNRYIILIDDYNNVMSNYLSLDLDADDRTKVTEFNVNMDLILKEKIEWLASLVDGLKKYQLELSNNKPDSDLDKTENQRVYLILVVLIIIGLLIAKVVHNKALHRTR